MRTTVVTLALAALLLPLPAAAAPAGLGLGIIAGEPTGVSLKVWTGEGTAVDGALAWSFGDHESFHAHVDWLWHEFGILGQGSGRTPVHFGAGLRFKARGDDHRDDGEDARFGVRIPVGIDHLFSRYPVELFGEVAPILDLVPETALRLNAAVGVRWYLR